MRTSLGRTSPGRTSPGRTSPGRTAPALAAAALAFSLTACADDGSTADSDAALVIYSGRSEELVDPLIDQLRDELSVPVDVRYGDTAELAAQLLEEGDNTEADLFFSQDAGALGALAKADLLAPLDDDAVSAVDERYRDADNRWVATSARARVIAYDPEQVSESDLPTGIDDLLDPAYDGKIGYAPTNASFHAFVTALRVDRGEDGAREWLEAFADLNPQAYEKNTPTLEAVDSGEIALGLINHYYWFELAAERAEGGVNARIHFLNTDDPGALVNVAGVGVLASSEDDELANRAVEFLLADEAQQFFADETAEYAVVDGITSTTHDVGSLDELEGFRVDLNDLDTLEETLELLEDVGLV